MACETLRECFRQKAEEFGEKRAVTFLRNGVVETVMSYQDLDRDANRLAHAFLEKGLTKGDRVVFFMEKSLFLVVAHLAAQKIGAIGVPLNPGFKKSEMTYLLGDAEASLALTSPEKVPFLNDIAPHLKTMAVDTGSPYGETRFFNSLPEEGPSINIQPEDPALIIYTSGTTGNPKGAVLTQRNLVHDAGNVVKTWEITDQDTICHALPLFHIHGLCFALHSALISGAHVVMLDQFTPNVATRVLSDKVGDEVCSVFMAVPSIYVKLMEHLGMRNLDFGHMRLWTSGSAPLLVKDFERIHSTFGQEPVEREGMTETGMNFSNPLRGRRKAGSIGVPLPQLEVRIVDPDTLQDVVRGRIGEIWLKGPGVTPGYWRKPEETARTFVDGWFRTGDLGKVDDEGYYYLTDRIKHVIISGGENISPKEVEAVINRYDGVAESSVVGVPDEKWGEKVVAAVVLKPGGHMGAEDLQAHCRKHLHNWKCPKDVLFVKELPRNTMGKVLKEKVKDFFLA